MIRGALCVLVITVMQIDVAGAMPPVQKYGKVSSAFRVTKPSDGVETRSLTNTFEAGANSYIWEPWFGLWRVNGAISRADTDAENDSTSDILTGDVEVNLFHRSHFPLTAFVGVRDSRVELGDLSEATSDVRIFRFGVTQQYQDLANGIYYLGTFDRDQQETLNDGTETTSNRLLLSADRRGEVHSLNGVFTANHSTSNVADSQVGFTQLVVTHDYRPGPDLSITSSADAAYLTGDSDVSDIEGQSYGASTRVEWRPQDDRLRVRGDLSVAHADNTVTGQPEQFRDSLRARASVRYELNDEASLFGELGMDQLRTNGSDEIRTFQALSGSYVATPIPLGNFTYDWGGGAGVANVTEGGAASTQTLNLDLNHGVTRSWVPQLSGPLPIVFNAAQEVHVEHDSELANQAQIVHRATLSATRATESGIGYGQLSMFDIRTFGRRDSGVFSLNAAFSYSMPLSRYRSLSSVGSYNFNASSSASSSAQNDAISIEMRYVDSRWFDISRLSAETRLRVDSRNVAARTDQKMSLEVEWDNRIDYRIGLLEISSRFGVTQSDDNRNVIFLISLSRRF